MEENELPHCSTEHEALMFEMKRLREELEKVGTEEKKNTLTRTKAETIIDAIKFSSSIIALLNLVGMIGGILLYFKK